MPTSVTRAFQGQQMAFVPGFCNLSAVTVNGSAVTYTNTAGIIRLAAPLNQGDALALTFESFRPADTGKNIGFGDGGGTTPAPTNPGTSTTTTWNPNDKQAAIQLSSDLLTFSTTDGGGVYEVRSTTKRSSGKLHFEVIKLGHDFECGLASQAPQVLGDMYNDPGSCFVLSGSTGTFFYRGTSLVSQTSGADPLNTVYGLSWDVDGGTVAFRKNGVTVTTLGYSPGEAKHIGGATSGSNASARLRTTAAQFTLAIPSGFTAWDS